MDEKLLVQPVLTTVDSTLVKVVLWNVMTECHLGSDLWQRPLRVTSVQLIFVLLRIVGRSDSSGSRGRDDEDGAIVGRPVGGRLLDSSEDRRCRGTVQDSLDGRKIRHGVSKEEWNLDENGCIDKKVER